MDSVLMNIDCMCWTGTNGTAMILCYKFVNGVALSINPDNRLGNYYARTRVCVIN